MERFRKAPPTNREERGKDFLLKDGKFSPLEEPQSHSTPDNSSQLDMNHIVKVMLTGSMAWEVFPTLMAVV